MDSTMDLTGQLELPGLSLFAPTTWVLTNWDGEDLRRDGDRLVTKSDNGPYDLTFHCVCYGFAPDLSQIQVRIDLKKSDKTSTNNWEEVSTASVHGSQHAPKVLDGLTAEMTLSGPSELTIKWTSQKFKAARERSDNKRFRWQVFINGEFVGDTGEMIVTSRRTMSRKKSTTSTSTGRPSFGAKRRRVESITTTDDAGAGSPSYAGGYQNDGELSPQDSLETPKSDRVVDPAAELKDVVAISTESKGFEVLRYIYTMKVAPVVEPQQDDHDLVIEMVMLALESGRHLVCCSDSQGNTLLHYCARSFPNNEPLVGAFFNAVRKGSSGRFLEAMPLRNDWGCTPLSNAVYAHNDVLINVMLKETLAEGSENARRVFRQVLLAKTMTKSNILHTAAGAGNISFVVMLRDNYEVFGLTRRDMRELLQAESLIHGSTPVEMLKHKIQRCEKLLPKRKAYESMLAVMEQLVEAFANAE
ncbi:hypothetical protein HK101_003751 [Irineochytrium annulatum]|nr:hypothetical protein HK101_003751 [Irineochytrium annulatum]